MVSFAPRRAALELCLDRAVQEIAREEAKSRLLDSGTAFYLDGWVPVPEEEKLLRKLGSSPAAGRRPTRRRRTTRWCPSSSRATPSPSR
ncbi:hypothetical protein M5E87_04015 [Flavonifractor plautii]|nr:hypothetical protein M5E87_04015 [Flavonifractor plautii]